MITYIYIMNLNHLAVFHAVALEGNISKGAERLLISQPAVSKQIRDLERNLKTTLFDRLPRGVRLTKAGALLAEHARRVFAATADAQRALDELKGLHRGRLAIGASTTIGVYLLPELFVRFRRLHPGVELRLDIANSIGVESLLIDGVIDIGLSESPMTSAGLDATVFMEDELVAIAPVGHPLTRKRKTTAEMLCREPFVVRETGSQSKSMAERALVDLGLSVRPAMSLGSTEAIKRAVAAGVGVAIVSRLAIELESEAGRIAIVHVSNLRIRRPLYRVAMRGTHASTAVSAFDMLLNEKTRNTASRLR